MHYIDYMMFMDLPSYFILWSRVLVILWLYYTTVTRPVYLMCIIYMSYHACTVSMHMIYPLDFSVIVITFSSWYCQTYRTSYFNALLVLLLHFNILSFTVLFLCVLLLVRFWRTFIIFLSRSESWCRKLIVEHILVQLFSGEFSFFYWLVLFRYGGWYCLWFSFSYMYFYPCAWLYMHIRVLSYSFWQLKVLMEEISLFVSID